MTDHLHTIQKTAGVILAGGRSSRFGGNKALALLAGRPVIQHVTDVITHLFASCLLVTHDPPIYEFLGLPVIGDIFAGSGPIAGIHAALHHLPVEQAFIVACDMPFIDPRLIRFLCSLNPADEYDCVIPWPTTGPEPLCALYHRSARATLEENLRRGRFKVKENLEMLKVRRVTETEILGVIPDLRSFHNINRPQDLTDQSP
jgi:molybdopterin-guanine dinucleotide biosynthesis protein A